MGCVSDRPVSMILTIFFLIAILPVGSALPVPRAEDASASESREAGIDPDSIGPFRVRHYKIRSKKLWKGLLAALKESGFPPEEIDEKERFVKTSFVDFESKDYPGEVVEPPAILRIDPNILQVTRIRGGKVAFQARVSKGPNGTQMSIRARILGQGHDRRKGIPVFVDRRSTGVIESEFIKQLEARLGIKSVDEIP